PHSPGPRVQVDPHAARRVGPLGLEVLGGGDHDDALDLPGAEEMVGDAQREGRLASPRGGDAQEVTRIAVDVLVERLLLPGAQAGGGTPRRPPGIGGRKGLKGGSTHTVAELYYFLV